MVRRKKARKTRKTARKSRKVSRKRVKACSYCETGSKGVAYNVASWVAESVGLKPMCACA